MANNTHEYNLGIALALYILNNRKLSTKGLTIQFEQYIKEHKELANTNYNIPQYLQIINEITRPFSIKYLTYVTTDTHLGMIDTLANTLNLSGKPLRDVYDNVCDELNVKPLGQKKYQTLRET